MQRFRPKALRALGFSVAFAQNLSHQFASFFISIHPDVSQACPKTLDSALPDDRIEIETYRNQLHPEIARSPI